MNRKQRASLLGFVLVAAVMMAGCPKGAYHTGVVIEHNAYSVVKAFQDGVETEFASGRIDQTERALLESKIEQIGKAGQTITADMQANASNTTISQDFAGLSSAVASLDPTIVGIKNAQSQATFKAFTKSVQAVVQNLSDFIASQKGA